MIGNTFFGWLVISLLTGLVCFFFAKEKGRNTTVWFVIGFFGSFLACLIVAFVSKKIQAKKSE